MTGRNVQDMLCKKYQTATFVNKYHAKTLRQHK